MEVEGWRLEDQGWSGFIVGNVVVFVGFVVCVCCLGVQRLKMLDDDVHHDWSVPGPSSDLVTRRDVNSSVVVQQPPDILRPTIVPSMGDVGKH